MQKLLRELNHVNRQTINAAGPRYSPSIDPNAPNLTIESLSLAVGTLAHSALYKELLEKFAQELTAAWESSSPSIKDLFVRSPQTPVKLSHQLALLQKRQPGTSGRILTSVARLVLKIDGLLSSRREDLWRRQVNSNIDPKESEKIRTELYEHDRFRRAFDPIHEFVDSVNFRAVTNNRLFIRGEWGTGKTHFLCDVTRLRMEKSLPTLFLLAHRLPSNPVLIDSIRVAAGQVGPSGKFLRRLNQLGKQAGGRALIIVDGINEGDRLKWRKGIYGLARLIAPYTHVGLVLSCRSPFDHQLLSTRARPLFTEIVHRGFEEIEFDAQKEFFRYYQIPNPHVRFLQRSFRAPSF